MRILGQSIRVAVLAASVLAAVGSASRPTAHTVQRHASVQHNFEDTWSAVIDVFSDHNWAIDKMDKASGLITTDWMSLGSEGDRYADCGTAALATSSATQVRFNVRVKEDGSDTSVTVNTSFRQPRSLGDDKMVVDCTSRGTVETQIQSEVDSDAAAAARKKPAKKLPTPTDGSASAGSEAAVAPSSDVDH